MNARYHVFEAQQDQNALPGGDSFVSIACHGLPGTIDVGNAIVTERGHMTRSQPENSGA